MAAGTTWLALGLLVATQGFDPAAAATKQLRSQDFAATILASEFAVVMFMDPASAHQGSTGARVKGISDPLGGLARAPSRIVIRPFLKKLLYKLCMDPLHTLVHNYICAAHFTPILRHAGGRR